MSDLPTDAKSASAAPMDPAPPRDAPSQTEGGALRPLAALPVWAWAGAAIVAVASLVSLSVAWKSHQRLVALEQEMVRRQDTSQGQVAEARLIAKQTQEGMLDVAAKVALLEARVAEVAIQRSQLEELIQSLSRSRDENILVDIEAGIRVALQQAAITGSAEPLLAVLRQADERLARYNQPRLERVRRAIARDLDRAKSAGAVDVSSLTIRLDDAIRIVDELPLLSSAEWGKGDEAAATKRSTGAAAPSSPAAASSVPPLALPAFMEGWRFVTERIWSEAKSLVRVTRIDHPEAMLLAPEQAFFLRENLKLRLLNARLAILSRQFETAQADLQVAQGSLNRYFERGSKRTALVIDSVRQVAAQARNVAVPRPDDTLAALATAEAGR